ncbi:MAG: hypothetical protein AAF645_14520, partial [Myxococcota bacterium]
RRSALDVDAPRAAGFDVLPALALLFVLLVIVALALAERRAILVLIALVGGALRVLLAPPTLLGAWFYSRTTPLQRLVEASPTLARLNAWSGERWSEVAILSSLDLAFALVTPFAVYAHGRLLLGHERVALLAAAFLATLPAHIRFSASEVAFIPSIVFSSAFFIAVHGCLKARVRWHRALAFAALIPVALAALYARPLNVLFAVLAVVYALFVARGPWLWRGAVAVITSAAGVWVTYVHLLERYASNVREGLSLQVIADAFALLLDPINNTLINPALSPPTLVVLIAVGAFFAARGRGQWREQLARVETRRVLFLVLWLALFFITHAYVIPSSPAVQARYHLHLAVPWVFAAALAAEAFPGRKLRVALVALTVLAPLTHQSFISDLEYNELQEFEFVQRMANRIEPECTVIEYAPDPLDARFVRGGMQMEDGRLFLPYRSLVWTGDSAPRAETSCVWVYEGLTCVAHKGRDETIAPACAAMLRTHSLSPIESRRYASRVYDGNLARGLGPSDETVSLTLYRAER